MMDYKVKVIEAHYVEKTYYISAKNKKDARLKAKGMEWYDATPDEPTGNLKVHQIKSITQH